MDKKGKTIIITLVFCFSFFCLFFINKTSRQRYPVLGESPVAAESLEDHREALEHWTAKGIKNTTLINIDAHDDIKRINFEGMEKLLSLYRQIDKGAADAELSRISNYPVTNGNFIYAAAKLGIVSKVYWVVPSTYGLFSDGGQLLPSLLAMYGFQDEDSRTFKRQDNCFSGSVDRVPVFICEAGNLPDIKGPVLISIDVDFFPAELGASDYKLTNSAKKTLIPMLQKKYAVKDVVVSNSVSSSFLSTNHRWLGELIIKFLGKPELLSQAELPDYYADLQKADLLLLMERYTDLLNYVLPAMEKNGYPPAMLMYAAQGYMGLGRTEESFLYAEKACLIEKNYCYGMSELGMIALDRQGLGPADNFFSRGYELYPEMDHGHFRYAMALKESGRYDDAIRYFKIFRDFNGPFPIDFYLAETYMLKGDEAAALKYYDSGRRELLKDPSAMVSFGDLNALKKAILFYYDKGYRNYAAEIKDAVESWGNSFTAH